MLDNAFQVSNTSFLMSLEYNFEPLRIKFNKKLQSFFELDHWLNKNLWIIFFALKTWCLDSFSSSLITLISFCIQTPLLLLHLTFLRDVSFLHSFSFAVHSFLHDLYPFSFSLFFSVTQLSSWLVIAHPIRFKSISMRGLFVVWGSVLFVLRRRRSIWRSSSREALVTSWFIMFVVVTKKWKETVDKKFIRQKIIDFLYCLVYHRIEFCSTDFFHDCFPIVSTRKTIFLLPRQWMSEMIKMRAVEFCRIFLSAHFRFHGHPEFFPLVQSVFLSFGLFVFFTHEIMLHRLVLLFLEILKKTSGNLKSWR